MQNLRISASQIEGWEGYEYELLDGHISELGGQLSEGEYVVVQSRVRFPNAAAYQRHLDSQDEPTSDPISAAVGRIGFRQ